MYCCVLGCRSNSNRRPRSGRADPVTRFYKFPSRHRNPEIYQLWMEKIGRSNFVPSRHATVCSLHFTADDYEPSVALKKELLPNERFLVLLKKAAVPSLLLNLEAASATVECKQEAQKDEGGTNARPFEGLPTSIANDVDVESEDGPRECCIGSANSLGELENHADLNMPEMSGCALEKYAFQEEPSVAIMAKRTCEEDTIGHFDPKTEPCEGPNRGTVETSDMILGDGNDCNGLDEQTVSASFDRWKPCQMPVPDCKHEINVCDSGKQNIPNIVFKQELNPHLGHPNVSRRFAVHEDAALLCSGERLVLPEKQLPNKPPDVGLMNATLENKQDIVSATNCSFGELSVSKDVTLERDMPTGMYSDEIRDCAPVVSSSNGKAAFVVAKKEVYVEPFQYHESEAATSKIGIEENQNSAEQLVPKLVIEEKITVFPKNRSRGRAKPTRSVKPIRRSSSRISKILKCVNDKDSLSLAKKKLNEIPSSKETMGSDEKSKLWKSSSVLSPKHIKQITKEYFSLKGFSGKHPESINKTSVDTISETIEFVVAREARRFEEYVTSVDIKESSRVLNNDANSKGQPCINGNSKPGSRTKKSRVNLAFPSNRSRATSPEQTKRFQMNDINGNRKPGSRTKKSRRNIAFPYNLNGDASPGQSKFFQVNDEFVSFAGERTDLSTLAIANQTKGISLGDATVKNDIEAKFEMKRSIGNEQTKIGSEKEATSSALDRKEAANPIFSCVVGGAAMLNQEHGDDTTISESPMVSRRSSGRIKRMVHPLESSDTNRIKSASKTSELSTDQCDLFGTKLTETPEDHISNVDYIDVHDKLSRVKEAHCCSTTSVATSRNICYSVEERRTSRRLNCPVKPAKFECLKNSIVLTETNGSDEVPESTSLMNVPPISEQKYGQETSARDQKSCSIEYEVGTMEIIREKIEASSYSDSCCKVPIYRGKGNRKTRKKRIKSSVPTSVELSVGNAEETRKKREPIQTSGGTFLVSSDVNPVERRGNRNHTKIQIDRSERSDTFASEMESSTLSERYAKKNKKKKRKKNRQRMKFYRRQDETIHESLDPYDFSIDPHEDFTPYASLKQSHVDQQIIGSSCHRIKTGTYDDLGQISSKILETIQSARRKNTKKNKSKDHKKVIVMALNPHSNAKAVNMTVAKKVKRNGTRLTESANFLQKPELPKTRKRKTNEGSEIHCSTNRITTTKINLSNTERFPKKIEPEKEDGNNVYAEESVNEAICQDLCDPSLIPRQREEAVRRTRRKNKKTEEVTLKETEKRSDLLQEQPALSKPSKRRKRVKHATRSVKEDRVASSELTKLQIVAVDTNVTLDGSSTEECLCESNDIKSTKTYANRNSPGDSLPKRKRRSDTSSEFYDQEGMKKAGKSWAKKARACGKNSVLKKTHVSEKGALTLEESRKRCSNEKYPFSTGMIQHVDTQGQPSSNASELFTNIITGKANKVRKRKGIRRKKNLCPETYPRTFVQCHEKDEAEPISKQSPTDLVSCSSAGNNISLQPSLHDDDNNEHVQSSIEIEENKNISVVRINFQEAVDAEQEELDVESMVVEAGNSAVETCVNKSDESVTEATASQEDYSREDILAQSLQALDDLIEKEYVEIEKKTADGRTNWTLPRYDEQEMLDICEKLEKMAGESFDLDDLESHECEHVGTSFNASLDVDNLGSRESGKGGDISKDGPYLSNVQFQKTVQQIGSTEENSNETELKLPHTKEHISDLGKISSGSIETLLVRDKRNEHDDDMLDKVYSSSYPKNKNVVSVIQDKDDCNIPHLRHVGSCQGDNEHSYENIFAEGSNTFYLELKKEPDLHVDRPTLPESKSVTTGETEDCHKNSIIDKQLTGRCIKTHLDEPCEADIISNVLPVSEYTNVSGDVENKLVIINQSNSAPRVGSYLNRLVPDGKRCSLTNCDECEIKDSSKNWLEKVCHQERVETHKIIGLDSEEKKADQNDSSVELEGESSHLNDEDNVTTGTVGNERLKDFECCNQTSITITHLTKVSVEAVGECENEFTRYSEQGNKVICAEVESGFYKSNIDTYEARAPNETENIESTGECERSLKRGQTSCSNEELSQRNQLPNCLDLPTKRTGDNYTENNKLEDNDEFDYTESINPSCDKDDGTKSLMKFETDDFIDKGKMILTDSDIKEASNESNDEVKLPLEFQNRLSEDMSYGKAKADKDNKYAYFDKIKVFIKTDVPSSEDELCDNAVVVCSAEEGSKKAKLPDEPQMQPPRIESFTQDCAVFVKQKQTKLSLDSRFQPIEVQSPSKQDFIGEDTAFVHQENNASLHNTQCLEGKSADSPIQSSKDQPSAKGSRDIVDTEDERNLNAGSIEQSKVNSEDEPGNIRYDVLSTNGEKSMHSFDKAKISSEVRVRSPEDEFNEIFNELPVTSNHEAISSMKPSETKLLDTSSVDKPDEESNAVQRESIAKQLQISKNMCIDKNTSHSVSTLDVARPIENCDEAKLQIADYTRHSEGNLTNRSRNDAFPVQCDERLHESCGEVSLSMEIQVQPATRVESSGEDAELPMEIHYRPLEYDCNKKGKYDVASTKNETTVSRSHGEANSSMVARVQSIGDVSSYEAKSSVELLIQSPEENSTKMYRNVVTTVQKEASSNELCDAASSFMEVQVQPATAKSSGEDAELPMEVDYQSREDDCNKKSKYHVAKIKNERTVNRSHDETNSPMVVRVQSTGDVSSYEAESSVELRIQPEEEDSTKMNSDSVTTVQNEASSSMEVQVQPATAESSGKDAESPMEFDYQSLKDGCNKTCKYGVANIKNETVVNRSHGEASSPAEVRVQSTRNVTSNEEKSSVKLRIQPPEEDSIKMKSNAIITVQNEASLNELCNEAHSSCEIQQIQPATTESSDKDAELPMDVHYQSLEDGCNKQSGYYVASIKNEATVNRSHDEANSAMVVRVQSAADKFSVEAKPSMESRIQVPEDHFTKTNSNAVTNVKSEASLREPCGEARLSAEVQVQPAYESGVEEAKLSMESRIQPMEDDSTQMTGNDSSTVQTEPSLNISCNAAESSNVIRAHPPSHYSCGEAEKLPIADYIKPPETNIPVNGNPNGDTIENEAGPNESCCEAALRSGLQSQAYKDECCDVLDNYKAVSNRGADGSQLFEENYDNLSNERNKNSARRTNNENAEIHSSVIGSIRVKQFAKETFNSSLPCENTPNVSIATSPSYAYVTNEDQVSFTDVTGDKRFEKILCKLKAENQRPTVGSIRVRGFAKENLDSHQADVYNQNTICVSQNRIEGITEVCNENCVSHGTSESSAAINGQNFLSIIESETKNIERELYKEYSERVGSIRVKPFARENTSLYQQASTINPTVIGSIRVKSFAKENFSASPQQVLPTTSILPSMFHMKQFELDRYSTSEIPNIEPLEASHVLSANSCDYFDTECDDMNTKRLRINGSLSELCRENIQNIENFNLENSAQFRGSAEHRSGCISASEGLNRMPITVNPCNASDMATLTNTLELFDTYKAQEEEKDSDEESFHLPLLDCDEDGESTSKADTDYKKKGVNGISGEENEDDILNKFDIVSASTPDLIDPKLEETLLEDKDDPKESEKASITETDARKNPENETKDCEAGEPEVNVKGAKDESGDMDVDKAGEEDAEQDKKDELNDTDSSMEVDPSCYLPNGFVEIDSCGNDGNQSFEETKSTVSENIEMETDIAMGSDEKQLNTNDHTTVVTEDSIHQATTEDSVQRQKETETNCEPKAATCSVESDGKQKQKENEASVEENQKEAEVSVEDEAVKTPAIMVETQPLLNDEDEKMTECPTVVEANDSIKEDKEQPVDKMDTSPVVNSEQAGETPIETEKDKQVTESDKKDQPKESTTANAESVAVCEVDANKPSETVCNVAGESDELEFEDAVCGKSGSAAAEGNDHSMDGSKECKIEKDAVSENEEGMEKDTAIETNREIVAAQEAENDVIMSCGDLLEGRTEPDTSNETTVERDAADKASVGELVADKASVGELVADKASVGELVADKASVGELVADKASAGELVADKASVGELVVVDKASVGELVADKASVGELIADKASVGELVAVEANVDEHVTDDACKKEDDLMIVVSEPTTEETAAVPSSVARADHQEPSEDTSTFPEPSKSPDLDSDDLLDVSMIRDQYEDDADLAAASVNDLQGDVDDTSNEKTEDNEDKEEKEDSSERTPSEVNDELVDAMLVDDDDPRTDADDSIAEEQERELLQLDDHRKPDDADSERADRAKADDDEDATAAARPGKTKKGDQGKEAAASSDATTEMMEEEALQSDASISEVLDSQPVKEKHAVAASGVLVAQATEQEVEKSASTKRSVSEVDSAENSSNKRVKLTVEEEKEHADKYNLRALLSLSEFMKNKDLKRLTRADLEEFCVQKICEVIVHKSEIGDINQQLRIQEHMVEQLRKDQQQLNKQVRDLEIVNKKLMQELRMNKKPLIPLRITRSVGLQVRLAGPADSAMKRNRPLIQQQQQQKPAAGVTTSTVLSPGNRLQRIAPAQASNVSPSTPRPIQPSPQKTQANTPILSSVLQNRRPPLTPVKQGAPQRRPETGKPGGSGSGVIDLTDEDDKRNEGKKAGGGGGGEMATKKVMQQVTPGKPIAMLSSGVRLATPAQVKTTPLTGVVTSSSAQLMYVLQPGTQLPSGVITTTAGAQKAVLLNVQSNGFLTSPILNGSAVSVIPKVANAVQPKVVSTIQTKSVLRPLATKHPAPLPVPPPSRNTNPNLKAVPPKPHLSIRKTDTGIILQWRMPYDLDAYEAIASYQLYAYQETNSAPSTEMWRRVGDVKALALPMACTLTQFADKNKYYFAVRPIDVYKRIGVFSDPEEISL